MHQLQRAMREAPLQQSRNRECTQTAQGKNCARFVNDCQSPQHQQQIWGLKSGAGRLCRC